MLARYDGMCPECGGEIMAGYDQIVMTDDGAVHEDCAPTTDEREPVTFPL